MNEESTTKTRKELNGYEIHADILEKVLEEDSDNCSEKWIAETKRSIKMLRIAAKLDDDEVDELFNTGMFNRILYAYFEAAMEDVNLTEEQKQALREGLSYSMECMNATRVRKRYCL